MDDTLPKPESSEFQINLSKCWQTKHSGICFQAKINKKTNGTWDNLKGYLSINTKNSPTLFWSEEKPADIFPNASGASTLIRKHLPSGRIEKVVYGTSENPDDFLTFLISTPTPGSLSEKNFFFLTLHLKPSLMIELIDQTGASLLRLSPSGLYSVKKNNAYRPIEEVVFDSMSIQLFLDSVGAFETSKNLAKPATSSVPDYIKKAKDRIRRRKKTLLKTLNQDSSKVSTLEEIRALEHLTLLLKSWLYLVVPGSAKLTLTAEQTGKDSLEIELEPLLSPGENLNRFHHSLARKKRSHELGSLRLAKLNKDIEQCGKLLEELEENTLLSESKVTELLATIGFLTSTNPDTGRSKSKFSKNIKTLGRTYKSSTGATIHVGRSAQENDVLTKQAKSNDWWFHVHHGQQGSHVVIDTKSLAKYELDQASKREACILALHFSKQSLSKEGEVVFTKKSNLKKIKGSPAGQWNVLRSESHRLNYTGEEVEKIFLREIRHDIIRVS